MDTSGSYTAPVVEGELSSIGGQELYQLNTGASALSATVSFRASGLSLLKPQLVVLDANQNVLANASSMNVLANDVSTHLTF